MNSFIHLRRSSMLKWSVKAVVLLHANPQLVISKTMYCATLWGNLQIYEVMFQDLECSPPQQVHYYCQHLTLSAPYRFFSVLFVCNTYTYTHTNSHTSTRLFVSPFFSLSFHRDDLFCFSPLLLQFSAALGVSAELHHSVWILNPHTGDARANTGE